MRDKMVTHEYEDTKYMELRKSWPKKLFNPLCRFHEPQLSEFDIWMLLPSGRLGPDWLKAIDAVEDIREPTTLRAQWTFEVSAALGKYEHSLSAGCCKGRRRPWVVQQLKNCG